ncbi:MAG: hypothetical protein EOP45_19460, partial [Sphingobacteriaceae bacterium]
MKPSLRKLRVSDQQNFYSAIWQCLSQDATLLSLFDFREEPSQDYVDRQLRRVTAERICQHSHTREYISDLLNSFEESHEVPAKLITLAHAKRIAVRDNLETIDALANVIISGQIQVSDIEISVLTEILLDLSGVH